MDDGASHARNRVFMQRRACARNSHRSRALFREEREKKEKKKKEKKKKREKKKRGLKKEFQSERDVLDMTLVL